MVHQFQGDHGGYLNPTEQNLAQMWVIKSQLEAKERTIRDTFDNEWVDDYCDIVHRQIDNIDDTLSYYGFEATDEHLMEVL